jgi:hypothetical protein
MQKFVQGLRQCIDCHGGHLELSKAVMADCNIILVTPQKFPFVLMSLTVVYESHNHTPHFTKLECDNSRTYQQTHYITSSLR